MRGGKFIVITALAVTLILSTSAGGAALSDAMRKAMIAIPQFPLWLAPIFARLGVADAQAILGYTTLTRDPCTGANWIQAAARQDQLFAEWQLIGYYDRTGTDGDADNEQLRLKQFQWILHWLTHFPDDAAGMGPEFERLLKLSPDQIREAKERVKTWKPTDEPPLNLRPCPGNKIYH
jgi:hypothetical protein